MSSMDCNRLQLELAIQGNLKLSYYCHSISRKKYTYLFCCFFSYLSHATEEPYSNGGRDSRGPVYNMDHAALSEQTINAMLRPLGFRGKSISVSTERQNFPSNHRILEIKKVTVKNVQKS